ncbi:hypothetical protein AGLY_009644 [Aphis glycines]|uniref:Endonuclease/exonuclease/phosphatase domain-containing protein n=1 Tax=Aphis glycines TaxID=307491 RepID=A0A6G0TGT8_APHGL|nr:hypothetical protein AGLY_009644 [Aphis glycines]
MTMTFTYFGNKDPKDTACNKIDEPPKCTNCGRKHVANSKICRERSKDIDNAVNVGVCRAAQDLALATATAMGIEVLVLRKPYSCRLEVEGWFSDAVARTAIVVFNPGLQIRTISPMDNAGFRQHQATRGHCFSRWGNHKKEPKEQALVNMTASLGLSVCNIGDKPTFSRVYAGGISRSHIDINFVTEMSSHLVRDRKTLDQYSASLHRCITFCVSGVTQRDHAPGEERWSWRKYDKPSLLKFIVWAETVTVDDAPSATRTLGRYLEDACKQLHAQRNVQGKQKACLLVDSGDL